MWVLSIVYHYEGARVVCGFTDWDTAHVTTLAFVEAYARREDAETTLKCPDRTEGTYYAIGTGTSILLEPALADPSPEQLLAEYRLKKSA